MRRLIALIALAGIAGPVASDTIPARADQYRRTLTRYAQIHLGMTAPVSMIAGQIHQESGFRPDAISPAGAQGLMQGMPATTKWFSEEIYPDVLGKPAPFSPAWNIQFGVLYDRYIYRYLARKLNPATVCDAWAMTLSGYNSGPGWTTRDAKACAAVSGCDPRLWWGNIEHHHDPRRHPSNIRESTDYPRKIILRWQPLYQAAGWGGPTICEDKL